MRHPFRTFAPVAAAFAFVLAGCETVGNARSAQRNAAGRGDGTHRPAASVADLRGKSLAELVAFACTNRPTIASAALEVDDARLALRQIASDAPLASSTPWNAFSASGSFGRSEQSTGDTRLHGKTHGTTGGSLSLDLLIWDFGRNDAERSAQVERVIAAEKKLCDERLSVFGEVTSSYFNWRENGALVLVALTNESVYAEHVRRAEAQLAAGEAKQLDVLRARLDLATAKEKTVAASNALASAEAVLVRSLGLDAALVDAEQTLGRPCEGLDCVYRGFPASAASAGELFAAACTNSPSVLVKRAELRAASHAIDAAVADLLPEITASASLNWTDPLWYWSWSGRVLEDIFTGFRRTTAIDRAVIALKSAAAGVDEAEQTLALAIEKAVVTRDDARQALATARVSLGTSLENLETVTRQMDLGEASRIDLSDAVSACSTSVGNCLSAFYDGQRAEAALLALCGGEIRYEEKKVTGEEK